MPTQENETLAMIAQLREELSTLKTRVSALERQAAKAASAAPSEEEMLTISAAVAAFLGVRARIRQVRLVHSSAWAQVGRMGTHASHHTH
jgi:methylmalonyl-CoA carboxyltransferase large subunit